jgi:hypothetical protein
VSELARVLAATHACVRRYVVLSEVQADAVALWTFHTHVH